MEERKKPSNTDDMLDPVTKKFRKGNSGGPGRPKGSYGFLKILRKYARSNDVNVPEKIYKVAMEMFESALDGDVSAAKLVLDRCCGILEKPSVEMTVQGRNVTLGPPEPKHGDMAEYLDKLNAVARQQGIVTATGANGRAKKNRNGNAPDS